MNDQSKNQMEENYKLIQKANENMLQTWLEHVLFSWQWWGGIVLTLLPWGLWLCFRKRDSEGRLLCAGFLVLIITSWLDFMGVAMGAWHYHMEVLPFIPSFLPWDFSLIPVTVMFFIQIKPKFNPFLKAILFAAIAAFIGEAIAIWLDFYDPEKWKHIYSFPIYIIVYLIAHFFGRKKDVV